MGRGGEGQEIEKKKTACSKQYTWAEVKKHDNRTDRWLVIDRQIYDITKWAYKHPGGSSVIGHWAGQDGSEAFRAFHNDLNFVQKFLKPIHVGELEDMDATVEDSEDKEIAMKADFDELRETAAKMGLFKPSILFYIITVLQLTAFEALGYVTVYLFGIGWIPILFSVLCNATSQAQGGWVQHDFGHLSVFKSSKWNHIFHSFTMNFCKGASSSWWNHLHFQHHSKPNVLNMDPDVRIDTLFVVGEEMPKMVAKERKTSMPYNWQHRYFFAIGPPLLFPLYFQYMIIRFPISRRRWLEVFVMSLFYIRMFWLYMPFLGFWGTVAYYFAFRIAESHWFVWVSQSNHIPMEISTDKKRPWLPLQLHATCDIEKSIFNDWFTGHLNFQIEHHLFPRMPRHNLYKIVPLVKSICKKHNVPYQTKTLHGAFYDIFKSLKSSGEIWQHYYDAYHSH